MRMDIGIRMERTSVCVGHDRVFSLVLGQGDHVEQRLDGRRGRWP